MMESINAARLLDFFRGGEAALTGHKEEVNALNVYPVPDGDTGTNMGLTIKSAVKNLNEAMTIKEICSTISRGALMGARGNSGVILSQILRGFTMELQNKSEISAADVAAALHKGVEIAYKSVLKPVEGTILTVSRKAAEAAMKARETESSVDGILAVAVEAGRVALEHTPEQLPVLKEAGVVDAGGRGFLYILEGGLAALRGEAIAMNGAGDELVVKDKTVAFSAEFQETEIKFGYCTELMIHNATKDHEYVREHLTREVEGDSLVCVGDEGIIKVHYHSNAPGKIITFAQSIGELFDIKVENMKEQMAREAAEKRALESQAASTGGNNLSVFTPKGPKKPCGLITVSSGDGITDIFEGLGADAVISGGQTMNPSAEDILRAIESVNAEAYIVLPNNGNVILAAKQAASICDAPVYVVPTKFMTQGLVALMEFNTSVSAEDNSEAMIDVLDIIENGEVTFAVRDTVADGVNIQANDILVLYDGRIVSAEESVEDGVFAFLNEADMKRASLVTLYYGSDVTAEEANALLEKIDEKYAEVEVEMYYGGQPLYYYLISVE